MVKVDESFRSLGAGNRRLQIRDSRLAAAARRLIAAVGGEHRRYDSNQSYSELNHEEQGNQLMDDAHFSFSLPASTPTHNASCWPFSRRSDLYPADGPGSMGIGQFRMGIERRWHACGRKIPVIYGLRAPVRHIPKTGAWEPPPELETAHI